MPLAQKLAQRYRQSGMPDDDLRQVASLGLVLALDRFDPERGHEFSSFATPTILGELKRYFRDFGWVIHVARSEKELVLMVNRVTEQVSQRLGRSPTPQEIAAACELSVEEVTRGLEVAAGARPGSLDEPAGADGESAPLFQRFGYEEPGFGLVDSRDAVSRSLGCLSEREHQVLYMRFFEDLTQSEIAERIGVSQMHVCRILRRALERSRIVSETTPGPPLPSSASRGG